MFDVSGDAVVVTGGSRGIGLAIARQFLSCGARVAIGGIDLAEVGLATEELVSSYGPNNIFGIAADISDPDAAEDLVNAAFRQFGRLDTVVANAGIDIIKPAIDYTVEEWDRVLDTNLRGAFFPAQAAAKRWIAQSYQGSIIFTSSIAAKAGVAGLAPYGASKGGIDQLVRNLAVEWAPHGIRVNAIAPGYVDNVMAGVTVHADPETEQRIRTFTPMGRRATVDEIAAPFVFLASPAASYITGAVLAVDGGYTSM